MERADGPRTRLCIDPILGRWPSLVWHRVVGSFAAARIVDPAIHSGEWPFSPHSELWAVRHGLSRPVIIPYSVILRPRPTKVFIRSANGASHVRLGQRPRHGRQSHQRAESPAHLHASIVERRRSHHWD